MQLRISPVKAYLSREMDMMDDNDPFVVLTLGSQTQRTKTKLNEKVPVWDQEFVFKSEGSNVLDVKVMDEDQLVNEEIGNCQIDLRPILQNQKNVEQYFQLKFGNIAAGKILLRIRFDGGQVQVKNSQNVRSHGEMKWYTPTQESITQYAMHLQSVGNLGNIIGQQQAQKKQQFLETQQKVLQSFPQQNNHNIQSNQSPLGYKGNLSQTAYQSYSPQSQINPPQYQSVSRLSMPRVQNRPAYQQQNFVPLNQPNSRLRYSELQNQGGFTVTQRSSERRPVIDSRNFSYFPPSPYYGGY